MSVLKRLGVFIGILCLLGAGACLLFWETVTGCAGVLTGGVGQGGYLLISADEMAGVYALGKDGGEYRLVKGDLTGRRAEAWTLDERALPTESRPSRLYPAADGTVYLGLYSFDNDSVTLWVYRVGNKGKTVEPVVSEPCYGETVQERMANVRLSDFSFVNGAVSFAVMTGDTARFYRIDPLGRLEQAKSVTRRDLRGAMALPDGELALITGEGLLRTDQKKIAFEDGEVVTGLAQAGTGVYYIDGAGARVYYASYSDWLPYAYLDLEKSGFDLNGLTDMAVSRDGDLLTLMNGRRLALIRDGSVYELSAMLYMPPWQCVLTLLGLALAVVILTAGLWYLLCEQRRLHVPMLISWGAASVVTAVLAVAGFSRFVAGPASLRAAEREAEAFLESAALMELGETEIETETLPELMSGHVSRAAGGLYRDTASLVYRRGPDGIWSLYAGDRAGRGVRAETVSGFDREQAERALREGSAFWTYRKGDETRFVLYAAREEYVLSVDAGGKRLLAAAGDNRDWMTGGLSALAAALCLLTLLLLCRLTFRLRSVARGMERLAAGERNVKVRVGGGDELEGLATDVNALALAMSAVEEGRNELAGAYRRFVPEQVLSLLGKSNIAEVDKHTFVSRRLAVMLLDLSLPEGNGASGGRELFDNVNEVIERTAPIVADKGGVAFSFGHSGYSAVFESGSAAAVSAAVAAQQAILSVNRERESGGRPLVSARIALEEDDVALGVIGDEYHLEPVFISAGSSVAKRLIRLCKQLGAGILCTETVLEGARGYSSRYMGRCAKGDAQIRVYEIFDADPYDVRKLKEQTSRSFSDGVYALYGRDFSTARSIFLNLVHRGDGDVGAGYFLYLSDRMEKEPDADISLDNVR